MAEIFTLKQGTTFRKSWTLYEGDDIVKPITNVQLGFPTVITSANHGLPVGVIPIALLDVGTKLSTAGIGLDDRVIAQKVDANTFKVNVDSTTFTAYVSGGYLVYTLPRDLTGLTARAHLRKKVTAPDPPLLSLTSSDGISLGGTEGTVDLEISADRTADIVDSKTYMHIEIVENAGPSEVVDRPIEIQFKLSKEGTR